MSNIEQSDRCFICHDQSEPLIKHCRCQISHPECLLKLVQYQRSETCSICRQKYQNLSSLISQKLKSFQLDEDTICQSDLLTILLLMMYWEFLAYPYFLEKYPNLEVIGFIYGAIIFSLIIISRDYFLANYSRQYVREVIFWSLFLILNKIIHNFHLLVKWSAQTEYNEIARINSFKYGILIIVNLAQFEIILRMSWKVGFPYFRILIPVLVIIVLDYFGTDLSFLEKLIQNFIFRDLDL